MLEAAESSLDADWHNLGCRQKVAPSHLPSPWLLSARVRYGSIFFHLLLPSKNNKIQFAALRLCTRAIKSTPSFCLLHSCDELPLHIQNKLLCLDYKAHLNTFPHHPTLPLISD